MEPLISIIVPAYKVEKYLGKCIESILNQIYKNLEIILVDDGSPDNCPQICDEYAKKDNRIIAIHQKNGGLSNARNSALNIARGEYIGFVDSDDYIAKDMYETLYKGIIENDAQMAICDFYHINELGEVVQDAIEPEIKEKIKILNQKEAMKEILWDKSIRGYVWTKLYKKECFDELRFPDGKNYEDVAISIKSFEKVNKIVYLNKKKYYYLQRGDSIDNNKTEKNVNDAMEIAYDRYKYVKENYPDLREYNVYAFIVRVLSTYRHIKRMQYLHLYDREDYLEMVKELKEDFLQVEEKAIKLLTVEQKMKWYTLIYDMELKKNI